MLIIFNRYSGSFPISFCGLGTCPIDMWFWEVTIIPLRSNSFSFCYIGNLPSHPPWLVNISGNFHLFISFSIYLLLIIDCELSCLVVDFKQFIKSYLCLLLQTKYLCYSQEQNEFAVVSKHNWI